MSGKSRLLVWIGIGACAMTAFAATVSESDGQASVLRERELIMPARATVRLFAFGDSGTGSTHQHRVATALEARCRQAPVQAVLLLGDIAYPGGVASVDDPKWRTHVFRPYEKTCLRDALIFPVLGNHDYEGNTQAWSDMAARNPRWVYPGRFYTVIYPQVLTLFGLDSKHPFAPWPGAPSAQSLTPWSLAIGHHPIVSGAVGPGRHRGGGIKGWWMKSRLCEAVDAYIAGHAHLLEHVPVDGCRMDQFVSGAAGGKLSGFRDGYDHAFGEAAFGFLEIELTASTMVFRFVSDENEILYTYRRVQPNVRLATGELQAVGERTPGAWENAPSGSDPGSGFVAQ